MPRTALIAGNWKMHGLTADLAYFDALAPVAVETDADVLICPPATLLMAAAARCGDGPVMIGGQDCHAHETGAHTGDLSAAMLADAGARFVILGHSERRCDHGETDQDVRAKAEAALAAGLVPIICVGETRGQRESGDAEHIVADQLAGSLPTNPQNMEVVIEGQKINGLSALSRCGRSVRDSPLPRRMLLRCTPSSGRACRNR